MKNDFFFDLDIPFAFSRKSLIDTTTARHKEALNSHNLYSSSLKALYNLRNRVHVCNKYNYN